MRNWVFIASLKQFRVHDFIRDYGFIEYIQKNPVQEGDTVYLYITAPYKRIEYKMVVEKDNIPPHEAFDDSAYSLIQSHTATNDKYKALRLLYVDRVQTDELCYSKLREHGFNMSVQTNRLLNDETTEYIESFFK